MGFNLSLTLKKSSAIGRTLLFSKQIKFNWMKKFLVLCALALASKVNAQVELEFYNKTQKEEDAQTRASFFGLKKVNTHWSVAYSGYVAHEEGDIMAGPYYKPSEQWGFGVLAGIETYPGAYRIGLVSQYETHKNEVFFLFEKGKGEDNLFYEISYLHKISESFSFGLKFWTDHGVGPKFEFEKSGFKMWAMPAVLAEKNVLLDKSTFLFGVSVSL